MAIDRNFGQFIETSNSCPDYWPLTRLQRVFQWLGVKIEREMCVYQIGPTRFVCSPRTFLKIKDSPTIVFRSGPPKG
jgi:hypothetical protein